SIIEDHQLHPVDGECLRRINRQLAACPRGTMSHERQDLGIEVFARGVTLKIDIDDRDPVSFDISMSRWVPPGPLVRKVCHPVPVELTSDGLDCRALARSEGCRHRGDSTSTEWFEFNRCHLVTKSLFEPLVQRRLSRTTHEELLDVPGMTLTLFASN